MRTIYRDIVSALIYSKDNKIFFGKKDPKGGGVYLDCWHIPGGGIEDGEDQIEALKREIFEEAGIDISNANIELISDTGRGSSEKTLKDTGEKVICEMHFFVYKIVLDQDSSEVKVNLTDDLCEHVWVGLDEITNFKLTPPSQKLFKELGLI